MTASYPSMNGTESKNSNCRFKAASKSGKHLCPSAVPQLPRQYREHKKLAPSYDIARNITIQVVYFDMKMPTSEVMAATRRLRNVGARMFVVQGNLTGATTKDFIRAVPVKKKLPALLNF